jgi:hypothetical protein
VAGLSYPGWGYGGSAATALLRCLVFVRMKSCTLRATPLVVARRCGSRRCLAVVVLAALLVAPVSGPPCLVGAAARPCLAVSLLLPLSLAALAARFFAGGSLFPCRECLIGVRAHRDSHRGFVAIVPYRRRRNLLFYLTQHYLRWIDQLFIARYQQRVYTEIPSQFAASVSSARAN